MANDVLDKTKKNMQKSEDSLQRELGNIRAGKANASILNNVKVEYYGTETPLNQVASISTPEARVILVTPYDASALEDIEKGILASDVGITPNNDGKALRLVVPQLTTEGRAEIAKQVGKEAEKAKVAVRNVRRDAMDDVKKQQKNGDISDDEMHDLEKQIQDLTNDSTKRIDEIAKNKEKEIKEG